MTIGAAVLLSQAGKVLSFFFTQA